MSHYFTNDDVKSEEKKVTFYIKEQEFTFYTDNGVFSKKGLDFGTRSLLENIPLDRIHGKVLDFGTGYGPIGIFIKKNTDASVDMIDINERSIGLAKKNALLSNVDVEIFSSDIYSSISHKYNFIITNPPIRVGKETLYKILFDAKNHLEKNGELWLVIHKDQGAKTLIKNLSESYKIIVVDKNKGFYVICAIYN